jgi:hypothetical protein
LSNFSYTPFELTNAGKFASVEAYWYWLYGAGEGVRQLYGFQAKRYGKEMLRKQYKSENALFEIKGFRDCIKAAFKAKVEQTPNLAGMLMASDLPFAHYYVFNGKVKKIKQHNWQIEFWEELRTKLKQQKGLFKNDVG